jgi:hypothetical protein
MDDTNAYREHMEQSQQGWEERCCRCGACCGAFEDPCEHLIRGAQGAYSCAMYASRLAGVHRSQAGKEFKCVPIREILHKHWKNDHLCAYKKQLRMPWVPA